MQKNSLEEFDVMEKNYFLFNLIEQFIRLGFS